MIESLPTARSMNGKVMFLLMDGIERTRWDMNKDLGFSLEKETTARARDLRKCGFNVECTPTRRSGEALYYYRMDLDRDELLLLKVYKYVATHLGSTIYEIAKGIDEHIEDVHEKVRALENLSRIAEAELRVCNVIGVEEKTFWITA